MALIKIKDTLSPDLARRASAAADKRPLLEVEDSAGKTRTVKVYYLKESPAP